jgi:hypothetical protein
MIGGDDESCAGSIRSSLLSRRAMLASPRCQEAHPHRRARLPSLRAERCRPFRQDDSQRHQYGMMAAYAEGMAILAAADAGSASVQWMRGPRR